MKRILFFVVASLALMSSASFAASNNTTIVKSTSFAPVTWTANKANGGFGLVNGSQKTMYVQITIVKGDIGVYTYSADHQMGCSCQGQKFCDLNAKKALKSVVCQLDPNVALAGDYDFAQTGEATGTYQILFAQ